jgi:hypothetical protein
MDMDKKPPVDPSLFIPIAIGACSIFGIVLVLLGLRLSAARGTIQTLITNTPVQFQYLGTEPVIALPTDSAPFEEETLPATETPTEIFLRPPTATRPITTQPFVTTPALVTTTASTPRTATVTLTPSALGATYDDVDLRLVYTGNWLSQSGVSGTYRSTLHISSTIGDAVQLIFFGQKIEMAYQAGPSLGSVAIRLDSSEFVLDQSAPETGPGQWESPAIALANHTITITHISGGSVNVDSFVIEDLSTATPTITPTSTP